jgi:hypothetical protein
MKHVYFDRSLNSSVLNLPEWRQELAAGDND